MNLTSRKPPAAPRVPGICESLINALIHAGLPLEYSNLISKVTIEGNGLALVEAYKAVGQGNFVMHCGTYYLGHD